jgi:hemoglobin-like flavoprotein
MRIAVTPSMFMAFGQALVDTIAERLGPEGFTDHMRQAWVTTYQMLQYAHVLPLVIFFLGYLPLRFG